MGTDSRKYILRLGIKDKTKQLKVPQILNKDRNYALLLLEQCSWIFLIKTARTKGKF